jgi:protein TonB
MMNRIGLMAAACLLACATPAPAAESIYLTAPIPAATQKVSMASNAREYRLDVARHIYESYPRRIFKGRLPPLIHAVVVLETTVDENGRPRDVQVVRGPSHAPDVTAAVREMTFRVGPLPVPAKIGKPVRYTEIWLVHKDGRFQLDALTEGLD